MRVTNVAALGVYSAMPNYKRFQMDQPRSQTHLTFAHNLKRIIETSSYGSVNGWAKAHKLETRNIARIIRGEQSPTLDTIHEISRLAGFQSWQMLLPDIDLDNPPMFTMTKVERDLYSRIREQLTNLPKS